LHNSTRLTVPGPDRAASSTSATWLTPMPVQEIVRLSNKYRNRGEEPSTPGHRSHP
jgi:hypothetical protein